MSDTAQPTGATATTPIVEKIHPTLFIALGGTGMKVNIRVRRRILNAIWGGNSQVQQIADFPVVQFVNFDLDSGEVTQDGKSVKTDVLAEQVSFTSEEKIIEQLNLSKYTHSIDELNRHREVAEWFPLTPEKIRHLGIDPSKGAGQIRALSRLYFFDKYPTIRDKLRDKVGRLLSNIGAQADKLKKLGLEIEPGKIRIVITGSAAGGTGSGSFLDMGYLAKAILKESNIAGKVDLFFVLPGGFHAYNTERVQANGYAALMELETCMRGNPLLKHWDATDNLFIDTRPYDDVYIIDNTNIAQAKTSDQEDIYEMLSDVLFTDFTSQDFANKKRSIAVNQNQHKIRSYTVRLPQDYGDNTELRFPCSYSSIGQATLDTRIDARQNVRLCRQVQQMLKAFFGVASAAAGGNRPTDKERDEFLKEQLNVTPRTFTELPEFLSRVELTVATGEFTHYQIADDLLQVDGDISVTGQIEQKVEALFERLQSGGADKEQWLTHVREIQQQLERDTKGSSVDSAERNHEVRIRENRFKRLAELTREDALPEKLFRRLDDDERGGLDYTLALVEMLKDRLENEGGGIIPALEKNAARFRELSEKLESAELAREFERLKETTDKGLFARLSGKDKQADTVLGQIKDTLRESLLFYVRFVAAREAALLLRDVSEWLGRKESVDHNGQPVWNGFVGRLQDGRNAVNQLLKRIDTDIAKIDASIKEEHATLIALTLVQNSEEAMGENPDVREWAKDAFKDFGGSKVLFGKLQTEEGQEELLSKLRNKSVQQLPRQASAADPLMAALGALNPDEQREKFRQLLQRAMPWTPLNLTGGFNINKDRYTCLIGVNDASEFKRVYGAMLGQCLPQGTGLNAGQIQFVESGTPGKLICFTELSGFPMPALTPLPTYLASYRKESTAIPLHVHKRISQFVQPIQFTQEQYRQFAEDFKLYLHAIALGVLKRLDNNLYEFYIDKEDFTIGDEFSIRQSGFKPVHRGDIENQVRSRTQRLNDAQVAALVVVFDEMSRSAYKAQKRIDEQGASESFQSFPFKIAELLKNEYKARLKRQVPGQEDHLVRSAEAALGQFSQFVVGSRADVYHDEVHPEHAEKISVRNEFFNEGWLDNLLNAQTPATAPVAAPAVAAPPPPPAPGGFAPPPPPAALPQYSYHLSVAGSTYGPYTTAQLQQYVQSGQVTRDSQLWREGMAGWQGAGQIVELASLFQPPVGGPPAAASIPPPPPPPVS
ncbi:GYF domain-containing protein [Pseudomonas sp. 21LCFQ010]|uniref:tubulin-like doman-containing protein n=1 Tax=Pseudomonas sp. 21LCFQ010 TaxID=2957506 RepID=UPI0020976BD0|nr:tubulin-like doman-containing protein [Pseudomonas sp. 21LCFQ010]MCO8161521.1 GYF domain-containing protein [Pseudomonas sp. 21LCFQ010]